jgi:hypothetical protein
MGTDGAKMPIIGETCHAYNIGKLGKSIHIYWPCPQCGYERWIEKHALIKGKTGGLCLLCWAEALARQNTGMIRTAEQRSKMGARGARNGAWKGGRFKSGGGYIELYLAPDDFFYPMADSNNRVKEHRLIMAKYLGRCLHKWEIVHHRNHIKDDNRIDNLELLSDIGHKGKTVLENRIQFLEQRVTALEAQNILLENRIKELLKERI